MRIAIPSNDRQTVEAHFGHCKEFVIFDCEGNRIITSEFATPPPHAPSVIPVFLAEKNTNVIISGGMGQMAVNLFKDNNIEVILGASGTINECLTQFLEGNLHSNGSVCDHIH